MSIRESHGCKWAPLVSALVLAGCALSKATVPFDAELDPSGQGGHDADVGAYDAGEKDAASPATDARVGLDDAGQDAGEPVTMLDAGTDASLPDASVEGPDSDVPPLPLTLDGVVHDAEWNDATWTTQNTQSNWGPTKNALLALGVLIEGDELWLAVRGTVEPANAIIVYVNSVAAAGVAPSALTDQTGELDNSLSAALTTPVGFAADYAWGTHAMGVNVATLDKSTGWRNLAKPSDLGWVDGAAAPTVCSTSACETHISLATLGSGSTLSLFARLTNTTGSAFANQTLPFDDVDAPGTVTKLLTLTR